MSTINIVREISRRTKELNLPLECFLDVVAIEEETFHKWFDGGLNPSQKNIKKLKELLTIIESLEEVKEKIITGTTPERQNTPHTEISLRKEPEEFIARPGFFDEEKGYFIFDNRAHRVYSSLFDL